MNFMYMVYRYYMVWKNVFELDCVYEGFGVLRVLVMRDWLYLWGPIINTRDIGPKGGSVLRGGPSKETYPIFKQGISRFEENHCKLWTIRATDKIGFEPSISYLSASRTEPLSHCWGLLELGNARYYWKLNSSNYCS